ncbi:MAG: hypothetical protein LUE92_06015 [Clostridiales bacterium]|nr:hypothetical protein [Clostridiales bacterium]
MTSSKPDVSVLNVAIRSPPFVILGRGNALYGKDSTKEAGTTAINKLKDTTNFREHIDKPLWRSANRGEREVREVEVAALVILFAVVTGSLITNWTLSELRQELKHLEFTVQMQVDQEMSKRPVPKRGVQYFGFRGHWDVIRFAVPYHAWYELEETEEWKAFDTLMEKYQREGIRTMRSEAGYPLGSEEVNKHGGQWIEK